MYRTSTQPIDKDKYVMNLGSPYDENNDLNGVNDDEKAMECFNYLTNDQPIRLRIKIDCEAAF